MADAVADPETFPRHLYYDLENQVWYEPLADGTVRVGFTPLAIELAGEVLAFTPKRVGKDFEAQRSFATIECGKWVGAARAAFAGVVTGSNDKLVQQPDLLNADAFGEGWMLIVRPSTPKWNNKLITGADVPTAFAEWLATGAYKDRTE